jgi:hypothetical protein
LGEITMASGSARRYLKSLNKLGPDVADPSKRMIETNPSSAQSADVIDIARISLAEDPNTRIRAFAEARDISPDRYAIRGGAIVYRGDDGVIYREIPEVDFTDPMSIFKNIAGSLGNVISEVPPATVGIATAPMTLTGPVGLGASMAATGGAGILAQQVREYLAQTFVGEQEGGERRVLEKGGVQALTQGIGGAISGRVQKNVVDDLSRIPQIRGAMTSLEEKASNLGIHLTPAELTDLNSLKAQQKLLGNLPQTADRLQRFMRRRAEKITERITKYFNKLSAEDSAELAGKGIRDSAKSAITAAEKAREQTASPIYRRAFEAGGEVDVTDVLAYIDDELVIAKGGIARQLEKARALLFRTVETIAEDGKLVSRQIPDGRLDALHQAKLAMDDIIEIDPGVRIGPTATRKLIEAKDLLLAAMDRASPLYRSARESFAEASKPIETLKKGIIGIISNIKDQNVQQAAAKLFDPKKSGPRAIAEARRILSAANPKEWQAVKRQWLQEQWEQAGREFVSAEVPIINQGAKFRALLLGGPQKRRMMKAALFPDEYKMLSDLADVLEAAGRVRPIGSDTAWNQEMMKIARSEATPFLAKLARVMKITQYGNMIENYYTERGLVKNAEKIAEIITTPGASKKIKTLLRAKPGSARFAVALVHFLSAGVQGKVPLLSGGATESVGRMEYKSTAPRADRKPSFRSSRPPQQMTR